MTWGKSNEKCQDALFILFTAKSPHNNQFIFFARKHTHIRGYIQKFPDWVDNEINYNNNKHSLRSNTKGYGGKTH
jgi:hypothetical protein